MINLTAKNQNDRIKIEPLNVLQKSWTDGHTHTHTDTQTHTHTHRQGHSIRSLDFVKVT